MQFDPRKTSEVVPNLNNRKPYRTKAQKAVAKANAVKNSKGYYNSYAPVSFHKVQGSKERT
jgi:hypothetical protein